MSKKSKRRKKEEEEESEDEGDGWLRPETKRSIWGIVLIVLGIILILAKAGKAGPVGEFLAKTFIALLGWGYLILPLSFVLGGGALITTNKKGPLG